MLPPVGRSRSVTSTDGVLGAAAIEPGGFVLIQRGSESGHC